MTSTSWQAQRWTRAVGATLRWLTAAPLARTEPERRRARLLAWLLLLLIGVAGVMLVLFLVAFSTTTPTLRMRYILLIAGIIILLTLTYGLNRAGHYTLAASIAVACTLLGPWTSVAADPTVLQGDVMTFVFMVLPVLLSSLLLSPRVTAGLAALQFGALVLLHIVSSAIASSNWIGFLAFVLLTSLLSIVASLISRQDMEQIDRQTAQLSRSEAQLHAILDNATAFVSLKDLQGRYLLVNRAFAAVTQLNRSQILGKTAADLFPREDADRSWADDRQVLQAGVSQEREESILRADGLHTYITVRFALRDSTGTAYALCVMSTDITARKQAEDALLHQSVRDPLTGLFNRRYLEETLERELHRAARAHEPLAVMMLDIDDFKHYNDTAGHAAGDAVLRGLGTFLGTRLRAADVGCRYGGEEFTLILPAAARETARLRAEQIRAQAKLLQVHYEGRTLAPITLSLGVAVFPDQGATTDALLKAADTALYDAKKAGRDRVVVADQR